MDEARCSDVPTAELALDLLDGRERAEVLDHVETCPRCRRELAGHRALADRLATLAPAAEPPPGFEGRVLGRLRPRGRRRPPSKVLAWSAAAVLAALVAVGAGVGLVGRGGSRPAPPTTVTANLTGAGGRVVGDVVVDGYRPRWISMSVHGLGASGTVRCEVVAAGGRDFYAGTFSVDGGAGSWSAPLPATGTVLAARLVSPGGQVLASARLP